MIDFNKLEVAEILPQRYPFLFIDKIVEFEANTKLVVLKNVSINEEYFQGHFPNMPVMPGALLIEAMGQAAMIFLNLSMSEETSLNRANVYYLCSVKARFFQPVKPGDQVFIEVAPIKITKNFGMLKIISRVCNKEIAKAELAGARQV